MTADIAQLQEILWVVNAAAALFLLVLLVVRGNCRIYPTFALYILANLSLGAFAFVIYRRWGFSSSSSLRAGWGLLALAICARALAVTEVCRHILARYRGIWALAWRILLVCAAFVLIYSGLAAKHQWKLALPSADRGLALSIAVVVVGLLFFARDYDVPVKPADRSLALGFCLYSCFRALNDTILENYFYDYRMLWNLLEMSAFSASLLVWIWALRESQIEPASEEVLLPAEIYQALAPQINDRLRLLDDQLSRFWHTEGTQS